jgi:folate-binding protein YgfZ
VDTAIVAPLDRFVAHVRGDEALAFLHAVLTADVEDLTLGTGALACSLDEKGHVLAEVRVLVAPDGRVLVDAEEAARAEVLVRLAGIAPLQGVSIEPLPMRVTALRGDGPTTARFEPLPSVEHRVVARGRALVVRVEWGGTGYDVLAPEYLADAAPDRMPYEAARIEAGRPRFGVDVTDAMLVNETPLLARAVSSTKGCYPGQETVARVANLGRIRRHLVIVDLDTPVPAGTTLAGGAGTMTSVAPSGGGAVAIAIVRADVGAGAPVEVKGARGTVRSVL